MTHWRELQKKVIDKASTPRWKQEALELFESLTDGLIKEDSREEERAYNRFLSESYYYLEFVEFFALSFCVSPMRTYTPEEVFKIAYDFNPELTLYLGAEAVLRRIAKNGTVH